MAQLGAYSGASGDIFNHAQPNQTKRSKFDLSRITNFTCDSGMIIPFDYITTLPGDTFSLSCEVGLETLPAVTNVLTPYRVRTHWYYLRNSDLWQGWNTFITKGRSGNVTLKIPQVSVNDIITYDSKKISFDSPHSLSSFIGLTPRNSRGYSSSTDIDVRDYLPYCSSVKTSAPYFFETGYKNPSKVSAFPFVAYQNICKYNYVNQNLLQNNIALFPVEGDNEWRLPYTIEKASTTNLCDTISGKYTLGSVYTSSDSPYSYDGVYRSSDTEVSLLQLRYAQFDDDYFTSALPWLQRGDVQTMPFDLSLSNVFDTDYSMSSTGSSFPVYNFRGTENYLFSQQSGSSTKMSLGSALNHMLSDSATALSSITANKLRELLAVSVWQERNARVNGSYNSMVWIHFNYNPNVDEHMPIFIGGSSSYVDFSQVLQTSESGSTPLGTSSGRGTLYDSSHIGTFNCPDYGIIMGILIISPMTTYNTQIEHSLICENVMEDFFFPEFENLSPQPVLNGELFPSGDDVIDKDLFGYQERYSYLKSRVNVNRGLFRLPSGVDTLFSASTQSREFDSLPSLSYQFVVQSPSNTRRDWLSTESEPMFKVQVASKVSAVRPLSYNSVPNNFGF